MFCGSLHVVSSDRRNEGGFVGKHFKNTDGLSIGTTLRIRGGDSVGMHGTSYNTMGGKVVGVSFDCVVFLFVKSKITSNSILEYALTWLCCISLLVG